MHLYTYGLLFTDSTIRKHSISWTSENFHEIFLGFYAAYFISTNGGFWCFIFSLMKP